MCLALSVSGFSLSEPGRAVWARVAPSLQAVPGLPGPRLRRSRPAVSPPRCLAWGGGDPLPRA